MTEEESMSRRIHEIVADRVNRELVGRESELADLLRFLQEDRAVILHLHGIGGIGKTSVVTALAARARATGIVVAFIDCRGIEPTEQAFLSEMEAIVGGTIRTVENLGERLAEAGSPVLIILDTYEVFRTMDTWLRQNFIPQLPDNVRVVFSGREPPVLSWFSSPGWQGLVRNIALGPISQESELRVLQRSGINDHEARTISRVSRGHPLALQLATSVAQERHSTDLEGAAISRVVTELTRLYLYEIDNPVTRLVLQAGSVVRSITLSILSAMLPDIAPQDGIEQLRTLPFVEQGRDGLHIHDVVQQSIATMLRSEDPERYRHYRRAAWLQLQREVRTAGKTDLWRYTADMLYILENPIVREAFFPSGAHEFFVEPARPDDYTVIRQISARYETPEATRLLDVHYQREPRTIWAIHDSNRQVAGYFAAVVPDSVSRAWMRSDPILRAWLDHLANHPVPRSQQALFVHRLLSDEYEEAPSPVQAGAWLEVKRLYMELKPQLRRVYFAQRDLDTPWPALEELGFYRAHDADVEIEGVPYLTAILDFGPLSVDGWLAGLVASELAVEEDNLLNIDAHEVLLHGEKIKLTPLEFGVMHCLYQHEGSAVSRDTLLEEVWGHEYAGGSNVVDVVIRSLRSKLGHEASMIETIRGIGYRLRRGGG
jgi:hypothetical protein